MYYLQSRYYVPEWGRFLNADLYVDTGTGILGTNMYAYCENDPVNYIDPVSYTHLNYLERQRINIMSTDCWFTTTKRWPQSIKRPERWNSLPRKLQWNGYALATAKIAIWLLVNVNVTGKRIAIVSRAIFLFRLQVVKRYCQRNPR